MDHAARLKPLVPARIRKLASPLAASVYRRRHVPRAYRDRYKMPSGDWLLHLYDELMENESTWMGVRALKNPLDTWIYQEILFRMRPDAIVELGSAQGGSTLFLCHMLDLLALDAGVVSVDQTHENFRAKHPRITTVTGDTRDPEVVDRVRALAAGKNALVIHDASHEADIVLEDLRNYAPLVGPRGWLIVEDGVRDYIAGRPGPVDAVERFLAESEGFELDPSCERFLLTNNPKGFLKRVSEGRPASDSGVR